MPEFTGTLKTPRQNGAPSSPVAGQLYYDTGTNILYWWNGSIWVPASGGGAGIEYENVWAAGTAYQAGDVVRHNGVDYLAVNPSTGQTPPAVTDLSIYQLRSEEGAAGGYASLDSGGKVPSAQLPPISSIDYENVWAAGTPYLPGDVVEYNLTKYLAVNPSTGQTPPPATIASEVPVPLVTSLPASPFDGQEVILVDSLTAPTYRWRFRYNAGSTSSYKWEFVGGTAAYAFVETDYNTSSSTYIDPGGPSILIPRAGEYDVECQAKIMAQTNALTHGACSYSIGALAASDDWAAQWVGQHALDRASVVRTYRPGIASAGLTIASRVKSGTSNGITVGGRVLIVTPVRVS